MRCRHPIYRQENVVIVNSSSISNQNDEFDFLKSTAKKVILAKDTSGNFFAEGFSAPLPRRPTPTGHQTAMGMGDLILDKVETQVWQVKLLIRPQTYLTQIQNL
uniref:Uncharacterized protein n=1 Tax=Cylindrotheca closterium TaxID=2856 RepID=A0A023IP37_9STRA|nr:hypothetical protein [Cylindrotheca closterium]AGY78405.1 hypothetical protein [Cylindrotheca closterium]